jgi:hypothetical protein
MAPSDNRLWKITYGICFALRIPAVEPLKPLQVAQRKTVIVHTSMHGWSRQVGGIYNATQELQISDCLMLSTDSTDSNLNLSSPRAWLQYWPDGAYTVIRCDHMCQRDNSPEWKVWGQDFHLDRLSASYISFLKVTYDLTNVSNAEREIISVASERVLQGLLAEAHNQAANHLADSSSGTSYQTYMATLLCHYDNAQHGAVVRGHICSVSVSAGLPPPVQVSIATNRNLGNRLHCPSAKLSSWCRERRVLEETYKVDGIGEVILTDALPSSIDDTSNRNRLLLEGLTSNLFVIRDNNTLQTAPSNVLPGYARHRVLQAARALGLKVVLEAPQLAECETWQGVFLTSSVKVISPVDRVVLVPEDGDIAVKSVWSNHFLSPLLQGIWSAVHAGNLPD